MSTNHTTNYNLCQWEPEDKVLRTDFNEDNAKIDAALKNLDADLSGKASSSALSSLQSTVNGKASQSDLDSLTKTVNGKADQSALDALKSSKADVTALNSLKSQVSTLEGVALQAKTGSYSGDGSYGSGSKKVLTFDRLPVLLIIRKSESYEGMVAPRGLTNTSSSMGSYSTNAAIHITWDSSKNQVSWYGETAWSHLNESGATYYYVAIY